MLFTTMIPISLVIHYDRVKASGDIPEHIDILEIYIVKGDRPKPFANLKDLEEYIIKTKSDEIIRQSWDDFERNWQPGRAREMTPAN